jgi:hypothetical protein
LLELSNQVYGHPLGAGQVLVGYAHCGGHAGGHLDHSVGDSSDATTIVPAPTEAAFVVGQPRPAANWRYKPAPRSEPEPEPEPEPIDDYLLTPYFHSCRCAF